MDSLSLFQLTDDTYFTLAGTSLLVYNNPPTDTGNPNPGKANQRDLQQHGRGRAPPSLWLIHINLPKFT
jgi:hypothetical protein